MNQNVNNFSGENTVIAKKAWSSPELKVLNKGIIQGGPFIIQLEVEIGNILDLGGKIPS